jgi:hypothetical protein
MCYIGKVHILSLSYVPHCVSLDVVLKGTTDGPTYLPSFDDHSLKSLTDESASGLKLYSMELYHPRNAMSECVAWNRTILEFETSGFSILH